MSSRNLLIFSLLLLFLTTLGLTLVPSTQSALANNRWSVEALQVFSSDSNIDALNADPPESHPHGAIWAANDALANGDSQAAIEWLTQLNTSNNPVVMDSLAKALMMKGQSTSALHIWAEINYEDRLSEIAREAQAQGNLDLEYHAFQIAYSHNPQAFTDQLVSVLQRQEESEKAIAVLKSSLENYSDHSSHAAWWAILGDIYRSQGAWLQAEKAYGQALAEDPWNSKLWIELGWLVYERENNLNLAKNYFLKAIEVFPEGGDGYYAIGQILVREGQPLDALEWFEQASEKEPDNLNNLLVYANWLRDSNQFDLALIEYKTAIEQFPESWPSYLYLAWGYYLNDHFENAIQTIEEAIELNDNDKGIYLLAGQIYEASGYIEEALAAYQRVLDLYPGNTTALEAIERLSNPSE